MPMRAKTPTTKPEASARALARFFQAAQGEGEAADFERGIEEGWARSARHPKRQETALHLACRVGRADLAGRLIQAGADLQARDVGGETALMGAVSEGGKGALACAKLLLGAGADPNAKNSVGQSALVDACIYKSTQAAKLLIDAGAKFDEPDGAGEWTPLTYACHNGAGGCAKLLLGLGARVQGADVTGWTPLHSAARMGHKACLEILLDAGAEVDARDGNGRTALMWACEKGAEAIVAILLARGADIDAEDHDAKTAEDHADADPFRAPKLWRLLAAERSRREAAQIERAVRQAPSARKAAL